MLVFHADGSVLLCFLCLLVEREGTDVWQPAKFLEFFDKARKRFKISLERCPLSMDRVRGTTNNKLYSQLNQSSAGS